MCKYCQVFLNSLFLVWLLLPCISTASKNPAELLLVVHDDHCKDPRSVYTALKEAGTLQSIGSSFPSGTSEAKPSSEMSLEERREQTFSALNLFITHRQKRTTSNSSQLYKESEDSPFPIRATYFPELRLDIIDVPDLQSDALFEFSQSLPCLVAERNYQRHLKAQVPNDYDRVSQWYLSKVGAEEAWNCYNG